MDLVESILNGQKSGQFSIRYPGGVNRYRSRGRGQNDWDQDDNDSDDRLPDDVPKVDPSERNYPRKLRTFVIQTPKKQTVYTYVGSSPRDIRLTIAKDKKGFCLQNMEHSPERFKVKYHTTPDKQYVGSSYDKGVLKVEFLTVERSSSKSSNSNIFGQW